MQVKTTHVHADACTSDACARCVARMQSRHVETSAPWPGPASTPLSPIPSQDATPVFKAAPGQAPKQPPAACAGHDGDAAQRDGAQRRDCQRHRAQGGRGPRQQRQQQQVRTATLQVVSPSASLRSLHWLNAGGRCTADAPAVLLTPCQQSDRDTPWHCTGCSSSST